MIQEVVFRSLVSFLREPCFIEESTLAVAGDQEKMKKKVSRKWHPFVLMGQQVSLLQ